eukprot:TRINITY_DN1035_c0_g1_i7.p1 TRINITY_DN1035_c0_g1~~TRINITY_DN1035_c0_g1_i7.p1  ORF type:complete len:835 (-),score=318.82 TRINITY_DN1035_c0_g1_i7:212-2716(-)
MGHLWRSEPMQLVQLFVQIEAAHDTVDELGNLGLIQFRDLNPDVNAFQRNFVNEVKRCDEMERKLRFFEAQVAQEPGVKRLLSSVSVDGAASSSSTTQSLDELEGRFDELEKELAQMNANQTMLNRNNNELVELQHVLTKDAVFFQEAYGNVGEPRRGEDARAPLLASGASSGVGGDMFGAAAGGVKLGFVTGVIARDKIPAFERVLWRATRGNLFMRQATVEQKLRDPVSGVEVEKNVFIIFFQGDRLQQKIKKICESFQANVYPSPDTTRERGELLNQVTHRLQDLEVVLTRSRENRKQVLASVAVHLQAWRTRVMKEKAIYHTMNMFNYDIGRKCLIAEGWCPKTATEEIQYALRRATQRSGALVPSILSVIRAVHEQPPTYNRTSKYTKAFQEIVNAYGIAHYREVNPAVLSIVTFPFLFGVMFGDVGHGFFLLIFSLILIIKEKQLGSQKLNEIIAMPFGGRYVLFLMSLFAIYAGFIYNEFFSLPMDIFGTTWHQPNSTSGNIPDLTRTYAFGIDPAWKGAPNELDFYNSFKMKMSIVFGILQMSVGIFLSFFNAMAMKRPHSVINMWLNVVPQIMFLWSIFGYMCFLIFYKWYIDWPHLPPPIPNPPFILPLIINMFLQPSTPPDPLMFPGQHTLHYFLLAVAGISLMLMLPVKLAVLKMLHNKEHNQVGHEKHHDDHHDHAGGVVHHQQDDFDDECLDVSHGDIEFSEVAIHQVIHTIEFVLGAISNTASYLRLWALSLAHSELSTVFWDRLVAGPVAGGSVPMIFVFWSVWFAGTFAVLLVMESLSAFLHALRLHWVEFQNKFYIGDGTRFAPFEYKTILNPEEQ